MVNEAYPFSPRGSGESLIKELTDPIAKLRKGVATAEVRPTHYSVQSGF